MNVIADRSGGDYDARQEGGRVRLVLYFDEAHDLTEELVEHKKTTRSAYMAMCSAINAFASLRLFVIFLSTNSNLAKYAPSKSLFWSARALKSPWGLQPPFVELPFDISERGYIVRGGEKSLEDVCKIEFMVKFGRPL